MAEAPAKQAKNRDDKGRFVPGTSGNPNGRPPAEFTITDLLRAEIARRPQLIKRWVDLMESDDERVALAAMEKAAHRLDGMPKQSAEVEHKGSLNVGLVWHDGEDA